MQLAGLKKGGSLNRVKEAVVFLLTSMLESVDLQP